MGAAHTDASHLQGVLSFVISHVAHDSHYPSPKIGSSAKPAIPSDISPEAQDFLQRTFELKHEARPAANELLQHPWIAVKRSKKGSARERKDKDKEANASPGPETV